MTFKISRPALLVLLLQLSRAWGFTVCPPSSSFRHEILSKERNILYRTTQIFDRRNSDVLYAKEKSGDDEEEPEHPSGNPYADPNYPDLEFVNYDDPEYSVDQGIDASMAPSTDELVEEMREDRRRRNDEYQFQTYFKDVLKNGKEYFGEWTVYKTSTFLPDSKVPDDPSGIPRLVKAGTKGDQPTMRVRSKGFKIEIDSDSPYAVDSERIRHVEKLVSLEEYESIKTGYGGSLDTDSGLGKPVVEEESPTSARSNDAILTEQEIISNTFWPDPLGPFDFRGHQGIMVCGNAWTICKGVPLVEDNGKEPHKGPFSEYRTEIGIQDGNNLRLRFKFDYSVLEKEKEKKDGKPPLHLKSMTVCRECLEMWPRGDGKGRSVEDAIMKEAFFGAPGAEGGLYDPPPISTEEQASQYMMLDLEGRATILFPFLLDQDDEKHNGEGWVHSLDWTPGSMRYQVDRKVNSGEDMLGLKTLELSEVQGADADTYRPRDGGQNMRQ